MKYYDVEITLAYPSPMS